MISHKIEMSLFLWSEILSAIIHINIRQSQNSLLYMSTMSYVTLSGMPVSARLERICQASSELTTEGPCLTALQIAFRLI